MVRLFLLPPTNSLGEVAERTGRKKRLQRLFRNPEASKLIKRCNDFGAGGVSVAIGELADGLEINLNAVPKKYDGLDGTELAISESQERMAVVVAAADADRFCELAKEENLEATVVAEVKENPYLKIFWNGKAIVNISRAFLDTNGAEKHIDIEIPMHEDFKRKVSGSFSDTYRELAGDLNICSKRGLSERFDSTIGAGTVLMPFGGIRQRTPNQAMVNLISVEKRTYFHLLSDVMGLQPLYRRKEPLSQCVSGSGGICIQAGCSQAHPSKMYTCPSRNTLKSR